MFLDSRGRVGKGGIGDASGVLGLQEKGGESVKLGMIVVFLDSRERGNWGVGREQEGCSQTPREG